MVVCSGRLIGMSQKKFVLLTIYWAPLARPSEWGKTQNQVSYLSVTNASIFSFISDFANFHSSHTRLLFVLRDNLRN